MIPSPQRGTSALLGLLLVLGTMGAPTIARSGASPAGSAITQAWGYVVSRRDKSETFAPAAKDRGNSSSGVNTVTWTEKGHYEVVLPGIATDAGAVVVSAIGTQPRRCVVELWFPDGPDEVVDIACYTRNGGPVDSSFVLVYLAMLGENPDTPPGVGYSWADQPANGAGYLPSRKYNSVVGSSNPVTRLAPGSYRAAMNALGSPGGNVQVVSVGGSAATCQATWSQESLQEAILVACRETGRARADSQFEVIFTDEAGLRGIGGGPAAYLLAHRPKATSYRARASHRFSTSGNAPTIERLAVGRWVVTLRGMPTGGAAVVTPAGDSAALCSVASIRKSGTPQRIGVRCFAPNGDPKDIAFSLSYVR